MNEVKRYDAGCDYAGEEEMVERADGDFVRHEDYAALKDSAMDCAYRLSKAQDDIKKAHMLHSMQKEEIANLKEQLTATTNSLTNAQEALKSAGIEADTVQAGVMELKDKLTLVREQRDSELNLNTELEAKLAELEQKKILLEQGCENSPLLHEMLDWKERAEAAELKLSNHNAVRAKGMEDAINILKALDASPFAIHALECRLYELRSGNAGKDGV